MISHILFKVHSLGMLLRCAISALGEETYALGRYLIMQLLILVLQKRSPLFPLYFFCCPLYCLKKS